VSTPETPLDVIVVGAGAAGVSAAISVANRNRSLALVSGQPALARIAAAQAIPNYPGLPGVAGADLAAAFERHLRALEVPLVPDKVAKIVPMGESFTLYSARHVYHARTVVLATGVYRDADIEGEDELVGQGVSYCASCDGRLFAGRRVAVIGYAPQGEQEAVELAADYGAQVTYLPLYEGPTRLPAAVESRPGERPTRLAREGAGVRLQLGAESLLVDGVFIVKEAVSPRALLDGVGSDGRHLIVDRHMHTAVPGVFAAGDCTGEPYQIAKAVGEGQMAAASALQLLAERAPAPEERAG
jgi:thioredoxin reductase (NADPH)